MASLAAAVLPPSVVAAQNATVEYAVKATYLYKFAPFVAWPVNALRGAGAPFVICIMQSDEMRALTERAVSGQKLGERAIIVRGAETLDSAHGCHILYIGVRNRQARIEVLTALRGEPTLTVTDTAEPTSKGIINFVLERNRVRFEIDDVQAAENGLLISSKLLSLAVAVRPRA